MVNRVNWAEKHMGFEWDQVIFSDESSFNTKTKPHKVWRNPSDQKKQTKKRYVHSTCVWGCFSKWGFGDLVFFKGRMNGEKYSEIIR